MKKILARVVNGTAPIKKPDAADRLEVQDPELIKVICPMRLSNTKKVQAYCPGISRRRGNFTGWRNSLNYMAWDIHHVCYDPCSLL